jgi:hypothetical protein
MVSDKKNPGKRLSKILFLIEKISLDIDRVSMFSSSGISEVLRDGL